MIEKILPSSKTRLRILENIYKNKDINLTNLIKKSRTSPNIVLDYVNKLVEFEVINEKRIGGHKKTHLRIFSPRFDNEKARMIFSMLEDNNKSLFSQKYKKIGRIIDSLKEIKRIDFVLIYGSYARFSPSKESDLDMLIIGKLTGKDIEKIRENFVTLDLEISIKVETMEKLKTNIKKPLYQNILNEHIVVLGTHNFILFLDDVDI